jgi:hypothetical protein
MKKILFCFAVLFVFGGCASNWNCAACKANADKDNASAGTSKILNETGAQKVK